MASGGIADLLVLAVTAVFADVPEVVPLGFGERRHGPIGGHEHIDATEFGPAAGAGLPSARGKARSQNSAGVLSVGKLPSQQAFLRQEGVAMAFRPTLHPEDMALGCQCKLNSRPECCGHNLK